MVKEMLLLLGGFVVVAGLSSCSTQSTSESEVFSSKVLLGTNTASNVEYLRINHHMVECEGYHVNHCLLVQKEGDEQWHIFYEQIDGFDFQWGNDYEILVEVLQVEPVLADASNQHYTLLEVIDKKKYDPTFEFEYKARKITERITELGAERFSLLGNKDFTCVHEVCEHVRSAIAQNQSALLSFRHSAVAAGPLKLTAVLCSDADVSFAESCL